jgi:hypothetical protein
MANNPFDILHDEIKILKELITKLPIQTGSLPDEIIDRKELCKRLAVSEPTAIRLGRRGDIPEIKLGDSIRYNWRTVVECLDKKSKVKGPRVNN